MIVTFTRTGERRYRVSIEGPSITTSYLEPAAGYDDRLPHDAAHFIVENDLGILGGVFGQFAATGHASSFVSEDKKKARKMKLRRKAVGKANRDDALFSEHVIYAVQPRWNNDPIIPDTKLSSADITRIAGKFEAFAKRWSKLPVGGAITLEWGHPTPTTRGARSRRV